MKENGKKSIVGLIIAWIIFLVSAFMLPLALNNTAEDLAAEEMSAADFYDSTQFDRVMEEYANSLIEALYECRPDEIRWKLDHAIEDSSVYWDLEIYYMEQNDESVPIAKSSYSSGRARPTETEYSCRGYEWSTDLESKQGTCMASGYLKVYLPRDVEEEYYETGYNSYLEEVNRIKTERSIRRDSDIALLIFSLAGVFFAGLYLIRRALRAGNESRLAAIAQKEKPAAGEALWVEEEKPFSPVGTILSLPADLFLAAGLIALPIADEIGYTIGYTIGWRFLTGYGWGFRRAAVFVILFLMVLFVLYRLAEKTFLRDLVIVKFWRWCSGVLKRFISRMLVGIRAMKTEYRLVLAATLCIAPIILISAIAGIAFCDEYEFVGILLAAILLAAALFLAAQVGSYLRRIRDGAKSIAEGDYSAEIPVTNLPSVLAEHAADLNRIRDGLTEAVSEQLKSERMKTELITNVSHDIKTPLTSIVNYVDLLQKEHTPEEEKEYLEILAKQASRLKKLTENLVEASKAASGAIDIYLQPMAVSEALNQAIGEYEEKFSAKGLKPVLRLPEQPVSVLADGRQFWRVIDNLLGNICKYSLENTRVYIECEEKGEEVELTFKNISAYELGISAEELTERFVRGDKSRSTEGSGLGLNIASSLMGLMKGRLELAIDGDLFKAKVVLVKAPEESGTE